MLVVREVAFSWVVVSGIAVDGVVVVVVVGGGGGALGVLGLRGDAVDVLVVLEKRTKMVVVGRKTKTKQKKPRPAMRTLLRRIFMLLQRVEPIYAQSPTLHSSQHVSFKTGAVKVAIEFASFEKSSAILRRHRLLSG